MPDKLFIYSHKGEYCVFFDNKLLSDTRILFEGEPHFLIDTKVARLYEQPLQALIQQERTLLIDATEENKSIERVTEIIRRLVDKKVRRNHTLVAIGGGIIQDITCFIASTLLRGLEWKFVPTTLLAQADSCIGSKSSINLGSVKNILGTFNPPKEIHLCADFLDTLTLKDIRSGIGEIIKVHAIDSPNSFDQLAKDYEDLTRERPLLDSYIRKALLIKKKYIEEDEFDKGVRNIFNYGHSFGHAIESATDFAIPHGIAVTMGMELANRVSVLRGTLDASHYERMRPILAQNYKEFHETTIPLETLLIALTKDKKNTSRKLTLIMPIGPSAKISRVEVSNDNVFFNQCEIALAGLQK